MLCCLTRFRFTIQRTQQKIILILRRLNRKLGCGCVFVATGNGRVHEVPSGIYGVNSGRHLMKLGGTVGRGSRVGWNRWVGEPSRAEPSRAGNRWAEEPSRAEPVGGGAESGGAEPGGTGGWGNRVGRNRGVGEPSRVEPVGGGRRRSRAGRNRWAEAVGGT